MSADHNTIQLALRTKMRTLVVATTGVTSLSATATGYARTAGSFIADNFAVGMEITPVGFGTNRPAVITEVTDALNIKATPFVIGVDANGVQTVTRPAMVVEGAAGGRSLTVGLPTMQALENRSLTPVPGIPYYEEQYIPGPESITTDGYSGLLDMEPMYSPRIYVPENTGITGDGRYTDAIRRMFSPGTIITITAGAQLEVRGDVGPSRGQRATGVAPGWSAVPITIPFILTTTSVPA